MEKKIGGERRDLSDCQVQRKFERDLGCMPWCQKTGDGRRAPALAGSDVKMSVFG
jgi:hypothetical protein